MKHNWTYKKLGEVATINYGTRVVQKRDGGTIYPVYGGGDATFRMDTYNRENCLVVARFAMSPKCTRRVVGKFFLNDSGLTLEAKEGVCQDYLDWHIIALNDEIYRTAKGAAQKNLDVKTFTSLSIGVPSLDEQQAIVRELDGINRLIDLQEEQLREYDRLAQSLFYTTFGEEEKWQKATLKDICSSIIRGPFGSALKKDFFVPKSSDTYKVYEQKHAIQKNATIGAYYITKEKFEELKRFEVFPEDIIMSCSGTIGELFVIPLDAEKGVMNQALLKFHLNELATIPYFLFVMEYVKSKMTVQGCGLQNIGSVKEICKIDFPLPPLALQQSFAAQIEAIEQQKALIRRSLEDTRTLLAARMQYYFE